MNLSKLTSSQTMARTTVFKPSSKKSYPSYNEMATEAFRFLADRHGSSRQAICTYVEATYPDVPKNYKLYLNRAVRTGVESGFFLKIKLSYKLSAKAHASLSK